MLNIKVLIVHPHMNFYGGAETVIVKLSEYLKKRSIDNAIITLSVSEEMSTICKDLDLITPKNKYDYNLRSTNIFNSLGVVNEILGLRKLLRININKFDLVNFHNFPATWSLFPYKKPSVWMCNEPPDLWNNPNPSISLRLMFKTGMAFDKYIVRKSVSAGCVADDFNAKRYVNRYDEKPEIIHYGVDNNFFSKGKAERMVSKYNLDKNFVLLHVGVLGPQKNQLESIKALEKVKSDIPNIKLILAGFDRNPYGEMLKEYIILHNLEKHVIFTGHVNKESIRDLYKACHIALYPIKSQGGWLSPFEALTASKPIIVSSVMSVSSIISNEKIGLVTYDFVDGIRRVYSNYVNYERIAENGNYWVRKNLSWESFGEKMITIFEKVIEYYDRKKYN